MERDLASYAAVLSSAEAVPGGGSAAAYAGALGAALAEMVANIAARKAEPGALQAFIDEAAALRAELLGYVDKDAEAFLDVSTAMKLPRATDAEKEARTERLQAALISAARPPLAIAAASRRVLTLCERALETASSATVSDVGVGALLAEAALRAAALNVMANLAWIADAGKVKVISEELDRSLDGSEAQRSAIVLTVESRIAR